MTAGYSQNTHVSSLDSSKIAHQKAYKKYINELKKTKTERHPNGIKKSKSKLSLFNTYRRKQWDTTGKLTSKDWDYQFMTTNSPSKSISYEYHPNGKRKEKERIKKKYGKLPIIHVWYYNSNGIRTDKKKKEYRVTF